ncbi:hypothetical protein, partial [Prevotella disiens]|uniref:hypothetical protein n=1 Tax=Prevotella disiens TaxID=28130 RepID=UPI001C7080A9
TKTKKPPTKWKIILTNKASPTPSAGRGIQNLLVARNRTFQAMILCRGVIFSLCSTTRITFLIH